MHWAGAPEGEPLEVGLVADVFAELDRYRPRTLGFDELRERLGADHDALDEALLDGFRRERLIPHAGPLQAASEVGERRSPPGSRAGRRPMDRTSRRWPTPPCAWRSPPRGC